MNKTVKNNWINSLKSIVEKKPLVILRFNKMEWEQLSESRRGVSEFTIARFHSLLEGISVPRACLIEGRSDDGNQLLFGLISSKAPVTTLESRIRVKRAVEIEPNSVSHLIRLVSKSPHKQNLKNKLLNKKPIVLLSPKLSSYLVERIASIKSNCGALRVIVDYFQTSTRITDARSLQKDAITMALRVFGLNPDEKALSLELIEGRETALSHINIYEDSVIEYDAQHIPGYILLERDFTGRSIFEKGNERLEVFTANRRPLEHIFGVDLIYLNTICQNIVMLQYKMMEPIYDDTGIKEWVYRPDKKLNREIMRMYKFMIDTKAGPHEYRLNPGIFYLKFVKREGRIRNGGIIIPVDHFEKIRPNPVFRGPKGGLRLTFESLSGRYLRQNAFINLISSGYIGGYAETTSHLKVLVEEVLKSNRAVVVAIQQCKEYQDDE